jgi:DNA repair protein RadC
VGEVRLSRLELRVDERVKLSGVADIPRYMAQRGLSLAPQETGWVLTLNNNLEVYSLVEVAKGTTCDLPVHIPTMLSAVLASGTDRFVFIHNHPGSSASPSNPDIYLTQRIADAATACDLRLEDHYIVTPDPEVWMSLRQAGLYEVEDAAEL